MYQALYRKYRPNNFDEVIGQEIIKKTLENAILNNKISHAYLFTGPRGTGKTSIAKILAQTVNCTNLNGFIPCDKCVNCTQIKNRQSNDIIEIDAASNNGIDEIREICNKVNLVPSTGKYKVYIIDEVHMLTTGAFNALLKTLEEPPSHIIFVLATTEPHKIPATILSRCQRFDFKRIPTIKIIERLKYIITKENICIEETAINEIARLSDGGMRDSINLLDQALAYSPDKITIEDVHEIIGSLPMDKLSVFVDLLLKKDIVKLLKLIDEFNESGKNLTKIFEEIVNYLKNILLYKISSNYLENLTNNYQIYADASKSVTKKQVVELISKFNIAINSIKTSSNSKLSIELLIINECIFQENNNDEKIVTNKTVNNSSTNKEKVLEVVKEISIAETVNESKKTILSDDTKEDSKQESNNLITLDDFKKVRINNALSKFNKNTLVCLRKNLYKIEDYLLDENYSNIASIIVDGELKVASDEYLVFVFKTNNMSVDFNNNVIIIQELFEKVFDKLYKVISTDDISWEIIKKDFNNKNKTFEYNEEPKNIEQIIMKNNSIQEIKELDNIFGDIVEYE